LKVGVGHELLGRAISAMAQTGFEYSSSNMTADFGRLQPDAKDRN